MNKKSKLIIIIVVILMLFIIGYIIGHTILNINKKDEGRIKVKIEKSEVKTLNLHKVSTYDKPIVPEGFKKVETDTASWEVDGDVPKGWNNGLVIEDEIGNQFVWVPVKDFVYDKSVTDTSLEFKQIYEYGGFYVARYEAGIPEEYIEEISESEIKTRGKNGNNNVGIPTSKKGKIPWNYIWWGTAKESAMNMYKDNEYVVSDLIGSRQWDYIEDWLKECGYNIEDCAEWGNFSNVNFEFTGYYSIDAVTFKYAANKMKQTYNMILSTGATERNKANNIYDLAGNLAEFVDASEISDNSCIRGGYYDNISSHNKISISNGNDRQGFRVVIYLK